MSYHPPITCSACGEIIPNDNWEGTDVECPNCRRRFDLLEVVG